MSMKDATRKRHFGRVLAALPAHLRKDASMDRMLCIGPARVRISTADTWAPLYFMKVGFTREIRTRIKCWRIRKDGEFSYQKVADHVANHLEAYYEEQKRIEEGERLAENRIKVLKAALKNDPKLSGLNLRMKAEVVDGTETGEAEIGIFCKESDPDWYEDGPMSGSMTYNGETFEGSIGFEKLSMEQLTALLVVMRIDQLNILDHITLADDSILGPIIERLHDQSRSMSESA